MQARGSGDWSEGDRAGNCLDPKLKEPARHHLHRSHQLGGSSPRHPQNIGAVSLQAQGLRQELAKCSSPCICVYMVVLMSLLSLHLSCAHGAFPEGQLCTLLGQALLLES